MSREWKDNPGYQPVANGVLVDVIYKDGQDNIGVKVGVNYVTGSNPKRNARYWGVTYDDVTTIMKWRLHKEDDELTEEQAWTLAGDLLNRIKESSKEMVTQ